MKLSHIEIIPTTIITGMVKEVDEGYLIATSDGFLQYLIDFSLYLSLINSKNSNKAKNVLSNIYKNIDSFNKNSSYISSHEYFYENFALLNEENLLYFSISLCGLIEFLYLHEFSHISLKHLNTNKKDYINDEIEADNEAFQIFYKKIFTGFNELDKNIIKYRKNLVVVFFISIIIMHTPDEEHFDFLKKRLLNIIDKNYTINPTLIHQVTLYYKINKIFKSKDRYKDLLIDISNSFKEKSTLLYFITKILQRF